jgi:hypothetical protein
MAASLLQDLSERYFLQRRTLKCFRHFFNKIYRKRAKTNKPKLSKESVKSKIIKGWYEN